MNTLGVVTVLRKELRDAIRSRWLTAFALTFAFVALALALVQQQGNVGAQGFNRTTASLINLCLLLVPLLALLVGSGAIAGERERGTWATLLAQPISSTELLVGKYLGLLVGLWATIALGFGAAGAVMGLISPLAGMGQFFMFIGLSCVLASAMLSIGVLISVVAEGRVKALALAILAWFVFVLLYQFVAIGVALSVASSGRALVGAVLLNPVEAVRILAVMSLAPDFQVLGPLGAYMHFEIGIGRTIALLGAAIFVWCVAPVLCAAHLLRAQDA